MLKHKLLAKEGILILEPSASLEASDFEAVAHEIDPYIAEHGTLAGVMVFAKAFPGWLNLEAAVAPYRKPSPKNQKIGGGERQWSAGRVAQNRRSSCTSGGQALFGIRIR